VLISPGSTSTYGSFLDEDISGYVLGPGLREGHPAAGRTIRGSVMKNVKWHIYRATMFLGTIAACITMLEQTAKRW
jgi:hypothetical protein